MALRGNLVLLLFAALLMLLCAIGSATTTPPTDEANIPTLLRSLAARKIKYLMSRNCDEMVTLYADNAVALDPSSSPIVGKELIRSQCHGFLNMMKAFEIEIESLYSMANPHQAVIHWLWFGITTNDCLFHLAGTTHIEFNDKLLIQRESDFYDTEQMRTRIFCNPEPLARLPDGERAPELEAGPAKPLLESPPKPDETFEVPPTVE